MRFSSPTTFFNPYNVCHAAGMRSGDTVVDLHCGYHGVCTYPAAELVGRDGRVYAVDIRRRALDSMHGRARSLGHAHIEPVWGDAQRAGGVPLHDGIADVVLLVNGFSELNETLAVVREAVRLLKSGGRLTVVDWRHTGDAAFGPPRTSRQSDACARSTCLVMPLKYEGAYDVGTHHYGFVCKKESFCA